MCEKVKQVCITFDPQEFPGNIIKTFFEYISEHLFHINIAQLPTIYCIVCGNDVNNHDLSIHNQFFGQLDKPLVELLSSKANNMYELVKQYIIYLLRNPNSHETMKNVILEHLHCPFCSGTSGCHIELQHKKWTVLWKIDTNNNRDNNEPPLPTQNIYDYTKSTFEWLVDQVPFYIPPFLLSLHYANYLRTFMENLVICWNSVKLVI